MDEYVAFEIHLSPGVRLLRLSMQSLSLACSKVEVQKQLTSEEQHWSPPHSN